MMAGLVVASMRPRQWVKNAFVLAPLLFAQKLTDPAAVVRSLAALVLFCLGSGAVYLLNDVLDKAADAAHPDKKLRPVASGRLDVSTALIASLAAAVVAVGVGIAFLPMLGGVLALYLALNLFYSTKGKHVPMLDLLLISGGFILRVVGGAVAIPVEISCWILGCTFLLAFYLGLGKRLHELGSVQEEGAGTRAVLKQYRGRLFQLVFWGAGAASVAAFTAYTLSERAVTHFGTTRLVFTVPFVAAGLFRYAMLSRDHVRSAPPTESLLTDKLTIAFALAWGLCAVAIIYGPVGG